MKIQTILAIASITILFAVSASLVDWNQTAEAAKAAGVKTNQFGQNTKDIVCGDRLCSEITSEDGTLQVRGGAMAEPKQNQHTYNINAIMNRMDVMHEQHQRHMIEMWNSMSHEDQERMAQKMHRMMDKMSSMNTDDFMSMMGSMHGDSHGEKKMHGNYHGEKKMHGDKKHGEYHGDKKMHSDKEYRNYHGDKEHKSMHDMLMSAFSDPEILEQVKAEMTRHQQTMMDLVEQGIDDPELKEKIKSKLQKHMEKSNHP